MSEQSQGTWLTQEAYDRLAAELEHRKTTERKEIAQRVEAARQEGDLRENAGYHAAREEAGLNEARIIQLEETLENAQIGEAADDGSVSAGTIVTAKVAGKEQVFALGGQEITADVPEGVKVFSPDAPLGKALMGHKAGETVTYAAPNGRQIEAEILSGDGRSRRPDRVMLATDDEEPCAVIVDYKFGLHKSTRYARQIRDYMALLGAMGYANVRGYLWYVELGETEEVSA